MNITEQEALQILEDKGNALNEILSLTENIEFTGQDTDAEKYVALFDEREVLMNIVKKSDEYLNSPAYEQLKSSSNLSKEFRFESELIQNNIVATAVRIIELDKVQKKKAVEIMQLLKINMKKVNESKSVNHLYNDDLSAYDGYGFDQKK